MAHTNTSIQYLKALKTKLNNNAMSLLVGAGLSKNVSDLFPSWSNLLFDMAKEMFESDIQNEYALLNSTKKHTTRIEDYNAYLAKRINNHINKIGFLQLVSNYIQQQGYREIIESYVEKRIPQIVIRDEKIHLSYINDGKIIEEEVKNEQLKLHKYLIELPWNNIYTTNYDRLLESTINPKIVTDLSSRIDELGLEIEEQEQVLITQEEELQLIEKKILGKETQKQNSLPKSQPSKTSEITEGFEDLASGITTNYESEHDLKFKKSNIEYNIKSARHIIDENINKRIQLKNLINECLSVVTHSSQLALKRNKNIIKLHGTLRNQDESDFGFDNDLHKHYVIAKEDYETYPKTHEAFTQLMRISLLQESFCLIGFSGIDPNFLVWVGWVRDIIQTKRNDNINIEDKIFLVETTDEIPSDDKKLFYKNHRIAHIPLLESSCISFLEHETRKKIVDKTSKKEGLQLLLEYLYDGFQFNKPQIALELLQQEEYKKLWSDISIHNLDNLNIQGVLQKSLKIELGHKSNRMPSVNFAYSHNKHSLLYFTAGIYNQISTIDEKAKLLKLIIVAIEDQCLPYSVYNENNIIDRIASEISEIELVNSFKLIQLRDAVWKNDIKNFNIIVKSINTHNPLFLQEISYLTALSTAINFDFTTLKSLLANWHAIDHWIMSKAGLIALFDLGSAIQLLETFTQRTFQEQLYALHMLSYFKQGLEIRYNKDIRDKIKILENEGLKTIELNTDYLISDVSKKPKDIKPYGDGKLSSGRRFTISNVSPDLQSIQYFGLLIESGMPLSIPRINFEALKDLYPLIKHSFRYYPFPILFYTLQCDDDDIIKRIAQDYAYCDAVKEDIIVLSNFLQKAYFDDNTPSVFRKNILLFYSNILIVLDPKNWQEFFLKVWKSKLMKNNLFIDLRLENNEFIINALLFIKKPEIISTILSDCLDNHSKNSNTSIQYLYKIAHNFWFEKSSKEIKSNTVKIKIDKLIQSITTNVNDAIFILGNIDPLLDRSEKAEIKKRLLQLDFGTIKNERIWHVILYFTDENIKIINKVKSAILISDKLWFSGITSTEGSFPYGCISRGRNASFGASPEPQYKYNTL